MEEIKLFKTLTIMTLIFLGLLVIETHTQINEYENELTEIRNEFNQVKE